MPVLTIAGSDSGAGAGIQADLKTFAALGVYGTTAITAVTAQNTVGVTDVVPLPPEFVVEQIKAVCDDIDIGAVKTGMLFSAGIISAVAEAITDHELSNVVVDPVMVSASGDMLLETDARKALIDLLPLATLVTPNRDEAQVLSGVTISDKDSLQRSAEIIFSLGPAAVLVKGGHISISEGKAVDVLFDGQRWYEYSAPIVQGQFHGTGCTLSAAIACGLEKGLSLADAACRAKEYVGVAIAGAYRVGAGIRPLHHFAERNWSW